MFFKSVNSRARVMLVSLLAWWVGAAILQRLPQAEPQAGGPCAHRHEQVRELAGRPASLLAIVGGMRGALANGAWLRAYAAWERRDAAQTVAWVKFAVAADERPLVFWLNGARMLAYDLPTWELEANAPQAVRAKRAADGVRRAVEWLEQGLRLHGPEVALYVELANIHWRAGGDLERAAQYYRLAAEQPGAPAYAARIHGELLRALGRPEEALAWLRQVLPTLDAADPQSRRDVVVARMRELEAELSRR